MLCSFLAGDPQTNLQLQEIREQLNKEREKHRVTAEELWKAQHELRKKSEEYEAARKREDSLANEVITLTDRLIVTDEENMVMESEKMALKKERNELTVELENKKEQMEKLQFIVKQLESEKTAFAQRICELEFKFNEKLIKTDLEHANKEVLQQSKEMRRINMQNEDRKLAAHGSGGFDIKPTGGMFCSRQPRQHTFLVYWNTLFAFMAVPSRMLPLQHLST